MASENVLLSDFWVYTEIRLSKDILLRTEAETFRLLAFQNMFVIYVSIKIQFNKNGNNFLRTLQINHQYNKSKSRKVRNLSEN